jgi:putative spermidine/putrescine transport system permease protein/spermidine/putrescine transport system permease protein
MAWLAWQSVHALDGSLSLENYWTLISDPTALTYLRTTFEMSFEVTAICALIGYPLAYALTLAPNWVSRWGMMFITLPLLTSVLVRTYAWLVILGRRGVLNTMLTDLKFIDEPLNLAYNYAGTLVGMVHVMTPMLVLPLYAAMKAIEPEYVRAAASLGASPTKAFTTVFFPLSVSGLLAGCTIIFILSLGYYVTPSILGGGKIVVWAIFVEQSVSFNPTWGSSAAAGLLLLFLTIAVLTIARFVMGVKPSGMRR